MLSGQICNVRKVWPRRQMCAPYPERIAAPNEHNADHSAGHIHDAKRFFARLVNALNVFPPEIDGDDNGEYCRTAIHRKADASMKMFQQLIQHSDQVQACRHTADRTGQNVIEHQRRDGELGQRGTHRLLDHAIHAATDEHAATLDVKRRYRTGKQHNPKDEPGRRLADEVLGDCARVEGRRTHIVEHNCGYAPKRNECEHGA